MNDIKIKQQIIEKIKASTNILVTVSTDPSVDALSAALGLTVMLNKIGKHATAVFGGAIPPAITFLDPAKTFEATTDSLRDFIIALDKEKADHLRYKVDGDVVKIFITPYRTTITSDDLEFSQGDYNVELVLALGVDNQDHLDSALEAQGKILHDATVVTLSAGDQTSTLGSIDWRDGSASSLSEMLVSLIDGLKSDKDKEPLLDSQIATALLTGIVAETDRFSNNKTSSKVMTVAAQLMTAGADQQLIATKLEESHEIGAGADKIDIPTSSPKISELPDAEVQSADGGMSIVHTQGQTLEDIANQVRANNQVAATKVAQDAVQDLSQTEVATVIQPPISAQHAYALEEEPVAEPVVATMTPANDEPLLGGTLNATTEQAAEDARREEESDQNKTILSHTYLSQSPSYSPAINSGTTLPPDATSIDIFAGDGSPQQALTPIDTLMPATEQLEPLSSATNMPNFTSETRDDVARNDALAAVHATFGGTSIPQSPTFSPAPGITLPPPPSLPDFSTLPPAPTILPAYAPDPAELATPERLGDIFPGSQSAQVTTSSNDPSQFQIPGQ